LQKLKLVKIIGKNKIIAIALICFCVLYGILRLTPYPELSTYQNQSYGFAIFDRYGRLLRVLPAADGVKREWTALDKIPVSVLRIFIRAEDRRFYFHPGVDPAAIIAASLRNLQMGRTVSGASTITMQLARLIKPGRYGLRGKLSEAYDALRLEVRLSKKQILELWINNIPFGSNIEGLTSVGRARFGRELAQLDDTRALLLAVIPRRPDLYDPARRPTAAVSAALALSRRSRLKLDEAALTYAAAEAAPDMLTDAKTPFYAPHFTNRINNRDGYLGPVRTTLDLDLQQYAEKKLAFELALLENNRVSNGAILAIDNASGSVLIYVGSASWFDDASGGKIDGIRIKNQPGSCLKPFLYALGLERGFLPSDILPDIPTVFGGSEAYSPANFNRRYNGPVRFRLALASSLNVPAVYLLEQLGVSTFEDWLVELGFESIETIRGNSGVGLALGNAEVSLEDLTRAFAIFPRGGRTLSLRFTETPEVQPEVRQLMSPYSAWIITDILSDRASRFTGFGSAQTLTTEFPSMFKTGTTNQFQHIWALGATPRYTVGVWMGNFSGETVIGSTGSSIPAIIASDLLRTLEQTGGPAEKRDFPPVPGNVREIQICTLSGMVAGSACPGLAGEWFPVESQPHPCTWHRASTGLATVTAEYPLAEYPPEYQAWLVERFRRGATQNPVSGAYIRLPVSGSVFYFDSALPPEAQAVRIETAGFNSGAHVYANGLLQGRINHAGVFALPLYRGSWRIMVEDENGTAITDIEVK
jgi:penicillin-binding protein 1C